MKIAIFHNYLDNIGGAEIVALHLARAFVADVYTTNIDEEKIVKMGFSDIIPRLYSIGHLPKAAPFRQQLAFWKFRRLNLVGKYDYFIIAGDWALSGAVKNHPNLWYAHSPLNELWQFKGYIRKELLSFWKRPIYDLWVFLNRCLSQKYLRFVDKLACNSLNTKKRISRFYGREAAIIYPPVKSPVNSNFVSGDYWLSVNRLAKHKRVEMQIEAFASLPQEKLIIVGSYEKGASQFEKCLQEVLAKKTDNVVIKHWLDNAELDRLYSGCKGFIATAKDEDFGLTVVEALSYGKPVIAAAEGGYLESLVDGVTGRLISNINAEKLCQEILEMNWRLAQDPESYRKACLQRAAIFSLPVFISKIKEIIYG